MQPPELETETLRAQLDEAYADRNLLAQLAALLARFAREQGADWNAWWNEDPMAPGWPVAIIRTPGGGQISYHVPAGEKLVALPANVAPWDGHTTEEKRERIRALLESGL